MKFAKMSNALPLFVDDCSCPECEENYDGHLEHKKELLASLKASFNGDCNARRLGDQETEDVVTLEGDNPAIVAPNARFVLFPRLRRRVSTPPNALSNSTLGSTPSPTTTTSNSSRISPGTRS
ncbi:hypothetical protein ABVK25_002047 [Lepraria finkii]|uniref:Uncharacterized protein n=1 Tax=Lepraria finkii TaxID=1340010 RepID=A0ABR4BJ19_9LECA